MRRTPFVHQIGVLQTTSPTYLHSSAILSNFGAIIHINICFCCELIPSLFVVPTLPIRISLENLAWDGAMYLRAKKRIKDGKEHRYWSIVESCRNLDGRVVHGQVLYLGDINVQSESRVVPHHRGPANGLQCKAGGPDPTDRLNFESMHESTCCFSG